VVVLPEPDWNLPHLAKEADSAMRLKAILADYKLSQGYIEELQSELLACG